MNHIEQLVYEWYEYQGFYYVRRNIPDGNRGELDIVAFHPIKRRLLHIECSEDSHSREQREERFKMKFARGAVHIPNLLAGLGELPEIERIAIFGHGIPKMGETVAGARLMSLKQLLAEVCEGVADKDHKPISESYPLLRTIRLFFSRSRGLGLKLSDLKLPLAASSTE